MGLLSIWTWNKGRKQYDYRATGGFWGYVLYPSTAFARRVGHEPTIGLEFLCGFFGENFKWDRSEKANYILANMVFYPLRIALNFIILFFSILGAYERI